MHTFTPQERTDLKGQLGFSFPRSSQIAIFVLSFHSLKDVSMLLELMEFEGAYGRRVHAEGRHRNSVVTNLDNNI